MTNFRSQAIISCFLAQAIWGAAGPLVKIILETVPPFTLLFLRCLFATIILGLVYHLKIKSRIPPLTFKEKLKISIVGLFGVFGNIALYFMAQRLTSVSDAWIIASTGTIFVVLYSFFFLRERLAKSVYFGVILAFFGSLIIIGAPIFQIGQGSLWGNFLMLLATLSGVISYLMTKKLVNKYSPFVLVYYFFLASLFATLPFFLWELYAAPALFSNFTFTEWSVLAYLVLGSSILAYFFSNYGLKHLCASVAVAIGYFSVIVSIGLSIIFFNERPTPYFWLGAVFIIIGLFFVETQHSKHPVHRIIKHFSKK